MWWLLACTAQVEDSRAGFLRDALIDDNQIWLSRDAQRVVEKFDRMEEDPYDFMRGTAGIFYRDLAQPDPERSRTRFLQDPRSFGILSVGDGHPENFGTLLPLENEGPSIEIVDLDAAGYGPWLDDLRRSVLGMQLFVEDLEGCGKECRSELAKVQVEAYVAALKSSEDQRLAPQNGRIVEDLLEQSWTDGRLNRRMLEEVHNGRLLRTGLTDGEGTLEPTDEEKAQLKWLLTDRPYRTLDAVRRFGVGVSSLPALRYTILADEGAEGPEDDFLLNLREVVNPPTLHSLQPTLFDSQSERIVYTSEHLWTRPDADPWLDGIDLGSISFKQGSHSSWSKNFSHTEVADGWETHRYGQEDLEGMARLMGTLLANCHLRGGSLQDSPAEILEGEIGGREEELVEEMVASAEEDRDRLLDDYEIFQDLREEYGPLLGFKALMDVVP